MTPLLRRIRRDLPPGAAWVFLVTAAHTLAYGLQMGPVVQLPTALLFVLTCPGALLMDWADLPNWTSRFALVVGASFAFNIVIVTLLLTSGIYSATRSLVIMGFLGVAMAFWTCLARPSTAARWSRLQAL